MNEFWTRNRRIFTDPVDLTNIFHSQAEDAVDQLVSVMACMPQKDRIILKKYLEKMFCSRCGETSKDCKCIAVVSQCKTCMGHGLWDDDTESPMGPIDCGDGLPTKACPECGANHNPIGATI